MKPIRAFVIAVFLYAVALAGCSGGGGGKAIPAVANGPNLSSNTAQVVFKIEVPGKMSQSRSRILSSRKTQYVSVNTLSLSVLLNTVNGATPAPTPTALVVNVTSTTNGCSADGSNPGNYTCALTTTFPVAADNVTITAYDAANASGNILSQTTTTFTPTAGIANPINLTLGGNPNTLTITPPTSSFITGSVVSGFTFIGSAMQSFGVNVTDPSGATIVGPGNPAISVTSANTALSTSGVSNAGFTLNASGFSTSAVQVTVNASPAANSGLSGLSTSFNVSQTPLIAVAFYQSGAGEVELFTPGSGTTMTLFNSTPISSGANDSYTVAFGATGLLAVGNAAGSGTQESISLYSTNAQASTTPAPQATTASGAAPAGAGNVQSIGVYSDGTVAATNNSGISNQVMLYPRGNLSSPVPLTMPSPSSAGYGGKALAFLPNGKIIVALISGSNSSAIAMVPAGATSCVSCTLITTGVNEPEGIAVNQSNGDFYVSNYAGGGATSGTITHYNESGTFQQTVASSLNKPFTLAISPDGNYAAYASGASDNIVNIASTGTTWTTQCTTTLTGAMRGLAWLPDNTLIASATGTVGRYNTSCSGTTITIPGSHQGSVVAVSP